MKYFRKLLAATAVIGLALGGRAFAQAPAAAPPPAQALMKIDTQSLASGYRASKVISRTVVNEAGKTVGTIEDLIIAPDTKVPWAVLSVGGFLGVGTKYVVIPFDQLVITAKSVVLPGATKASMKALPDFKFDS